MKTTNFVTLEKLRRIMDTIEIKNRIHNYIEHADERVLRMIYAMLNQDEKSIIAYTADGKPLTKSAYREALALTEKEIEQGKIISQEDLEKESEQW